MRYLRDLGWRETSDTYLAARFRAAGFVFLGKTNLPELAGRATTQSVAFGATRNPWDLARSPGGSSGGSAAAVAAGMVPVAHGNDGYGSIRIPASACGLVGLKPSRGRTSIGPARSSGLLGNVVEHVLTRSVQDTAAILDAVAGPMPGDLFGLFTMPFSVTGQPAISLPLHWTADGLPVGVQLVADYGREDLLIRVASQLESARPWLARRPPLAC